MGWHLDGRVTAVLGTHAHILTSDERVLRGGTAYQTDVSMSGPPLTAASPPNRAASCRNPSPAWPANSKPPRDIRRCVPR